MALRCAFAAAYPDDFLVGCSLFAIRVFFSPDEGESREPSVTYVWTLGATALKEIQPNPLRFAG